MEGLPKWSKKTTRHGVPKIKGLSFEIDSGRGGDSTTNFKEHRWRVQGRREEHHGIYDTFGWNISQNETSEDSVPRQLKLEMIAFHQHEPFWVNANIEGSTRQKYRHPKATQGKRWVRSSRCRSSYASRNHVGRSRERAESSHRGCCAE